MRTLALWAALALPSVIALSACDSSGAPDGPAGEFEIGGTYSATTETFSNGETVVTFEIPDTESGNTFGYSFTRRTERGGNVERSVSNGTGTYIHPDVDLVTDGAPLSGTASNDGDRLTLSDGSSAAVTFQR